MIRSSGPIARPLASFHTLCRTFRWLCITPFGRPVEPDVKRTYARSPAETDAVEAAAAAVAGPASQRLELEHRNAGRGQGPRPRRRGDFGDDRSRVEIAQDRLEPRIRQRRVERDVRPPGLERPQHRREERRSGASNEGDRRFAARSIEAIGKRRGDRGRAGFELRVRDRAPGLAHGRPVRVCARGPPETLGNRAFDLFLRKGRRHRSPGGFEKNSTSPGPCSGRPEAGRLPAAEGRVGVGVRPWTSST